MIERDTCSGFSCCAFTGLALLQSSCPSNQCLAFISTTMIHFQLLTLFLDRVHSANISSRPSFRATIDIFNQVSSICSLPLQNTDSSVSIGRSTSPDGSSKHAMLVIEKQFHSGQSRLFCYSVFHVLPSFRSSLAAA